MLGRGDDRCRCEGERWPDQTMKLELCQDPEGLGSLRSEWNTLLQSSASNVLFLTWEWQCAWWNSFGAGKTLCMLIIRDEGGDLKAVVPLFVQETLLAASTALPGINVEHPRDVANGEWKRTVHLIGGTEVSDYLDIIAPAELVHDVAALFLDFLAGMEDWQILDLHSLPIESPTVRAVVESARARGWSAFQVTEDVCPVLELPSTWEEYLSERLNRKQRHELRRKMRRAAKRTKVDWHWIDDVTGLQEGMDVFLRLHKASAPDKKAFMDGRMQGFFREVADSALESGWLRLSVLRFDGQPVASYLCFDYANDRLVYNSGFDLSTYHALSPGIVLLGYLIRDAIERGYRRVDFLQGGERYKYGFGATDTEVVRLVIRR